jgi:hypothetical protein
MHTFRHLTQKGDPRLKVSIPKALKAMVLESAKLRKQQPQSEIIKRLITTFKYEEAYQALQPDLLQQLPKSSGHNAALAASHILLAKEQHRDQKALRRN